MIKNKIFDCITFYQANLLFQLRFEILKDIVDYGFSIKYFRNHSDLCLAGEDKEFIKLFSLLSLYF